MTSKLTITDDKLSALLSEMERSFTGFQGHGYTDAAEEYIDMISALRELQERRKADQDSVHKRNPVLAYADSYRDMAKQGVESVQIWSVITDLERNIAPLYRHAQPAPVVQKVMSRLAYLLDEDQFHNIESMVLAAGIHPAGTSQVIPEVMSMEDLQYKPLTKSWREGWNACRAAMLNGGKS